LRAARNSSITTRKTPSRPRRKAPASNQEKLVLGRFLPYLLNRAGAQTAQVFGTVLKEFGLTLPEWRILIALWQNEDRRLRDLSEITVVDHSTLSRQISNLERANLVTRGRSKDDGRALRIALTAKGKKITSTLIPIARAQAAAAIQGLTKQQLATLEECLMRIFENLRTFEEQGAANVHGAG
jgi:DNA-binding MarR family transcriptional regulator